MVTQRDLELPVDLRVPTVSEQDLGGAELDGRARAPVGDPDDVALIYLTSGSTGQAKAVPHTNGRLGAMLRIQSGAVGQRPGERGAMLYPLSFLGGLVIGGGELLSGATVCIYDLGSRGIDRLGEWIDEQEIAYLSAVPSVLSTLTTSMEQRARVARSVRFLAFGGEGFARHELDAVRRVFPAATLCNAYGSQEASTVTTFVLPPDADLPSGAIPAGTPLHGYGVAVVDPGGVPVGLGESGEITFFGPHVIDGYWNDPLLDAQQFVTLPDGTRALRSGDVGRVTDGVVEVLGRLDGRVKVRGNGVDTVEVEHALAGLDGVVDAAITPVTLPDGTVRLVAHVELVPIDQPTIGALRRELGRVLPAFAVPSRFVIMYELPHTVRGKVDRAALRDDALRVVPREAPVKPNGPLEIALVARFEEILDLDDVGATDDFFELGGDSLDAVELLLSLETLTDLRLAPSQLLAAATPRKLARALDEGPGVATTVVPLVTGDPDRIPFVCVAGGGAHALFLRPLARRLDARTVYGVHARGIENHEAFDRTVEARARGHLEDLRRIHPRGPYVLAGHSFGGLVALEMAEQLRADGDVVPLVVLLDTDLPDPNAHRLDDVVPKFRELFPGDGIGPRSRRGVRLAYVSVRRRSAAVLGRFRGLSDSRRREAFAHINAGLALGYEPRPGPGPVLVLRAESDDEPLRLRREPDLGWGPFVTSDLTVVPVPAHHVTMVREPEVAEVARVLVEALDPLDGDPS